MSVIHDTEPEDEYDSTDRVEERLRVINAIIAALTATVTPERRAFRKALIAGLLDELAADLDGFAAQLQIARDRVS